jgi:hypothetical protein
LPDETSSLSTPYIAKIRQSHFSPRFIVPSNVFGAGIGKDCGIIAVLNKKREEEHEMKKLVGISTVLLLASAFVVAQSQDTSGAASQSAGQTSSQGSSASQTSPSSAGQSSSTSSSTDQSSTDASGKKAKKHKKNKKESSDSSMSGSSTSGTGTSSSGSSTQTTPPPQQ